MSCDENCETNLKTTNYHYEICAAEKNIVCEDVLNSSCNKFLKNFLTFGFSDHWFLPNYWQLLLDQGYHSMANHYSSVNVTAIFDLTSKTPLFSHYLFSVESTDSTVKISLFFS